MLIHILRDTDLYSEVGTFHAQSMEAAALYVGEEFGFDKFSYLPDDEYQEQYAAAEAIAADTGFY